MWAMEKEKNALLCDRFLMNILLDRVVVQYEIQLCAPITEGKIGQEGLSKE
jgi:hypothetical protein